MSDTQAVVITDATPDDCDAIVRIHTASWRFTYRGSLRDEYLDGDIETAKYDQWSKRLAVPAINQKIFVARGNNTALGFACLYTHHNADKGHLLDAIHLDPSVKRVGIGSALFKAVVAYARTIPPAAGLHLYVNKSNSGAHRFYDAQGGVIIGAFDWHAPDGSVVPRLIYGWQADYLSHASAR